jgi:hypothetical protein
MPIELSGGGPRSCHSPAGIRRRHATVALSPVRAHRGTEGSNPFRSSGESCANPAVINPLDDNLVKRRIRLSDFSNALGKPIKAVNFQDCELYGPAHCRPALIFFVIGGGLRGDPKGPLFRTIGRRTGKLTRRVLPQAPVR